LWYLPHNRQGVGRVSHEKEGVELIASVMVWWYWLIRSIFHSPLAGRVKMQAGLQEKPARLERAFPLL